MLATASTNEHDPAYVLRGQRIKIVMVAGNHFAVHSARQFDRKTIAQCDFVGGFEFSNTHPEAGAHITSTANAGTSKIADRRLCSGHVRRTTKVVIDFTQIDCMSNTS